jgi:hypothetical protein
MTVALREERIDIPALIARQRRGYSLEQPF